MHAYFFFYDTATTEIYTLSLHDALPISGAKTCAGSTPFHIRMCTRLHTRVCTRLFAREQWERSEEHTSELQSRQYLVCRLLLEKKLHHSHSLFFFALRRLLSSCVFLYSC